MPSSSTNDILAAPTVPYRPTEPPRYDGISTLAAKMSSSLAPLLNSSLDGSETKAAVEASHPAYVEELSHLSSSSVSDRASRISIAHLLGWLLLFMALTMTTVILLNACLRRRSADDEEYDAQQQDTEMKTAAPLPNTDRPVAVDIHETTPTTSSSRLLASRGNLARQQFLESRKGGSSQPASSSPLNYGATSSISGAQ